MNKTIHQLDTLTPIESADEMIVYDVSTGTSKKVQVKDVAGNYSETETLTGATWYDGKPIYRKVIPLEITALAEKTWTTCATFNNNNIAVLTNAKIVGKNVNLPRIFNFTDIRVDGNNILYYSAVGSSSLTNMVLILEYTKTT